MMTSRAASVLLPAFLLMTVGGLVFQVLLPILAPEICVSFVDGGVFRSWAGFGLRETLVQAVALTLLIACWMGIGEPADDAPKRHGPSIITAFSIGAGSILMAVFLAIRVPAEVILAWAALTLMQTVIGGVAARRLATAKWRKTLAASISLVSLACVTSLLTFAYYFPAPFPDETFTTQGPNGKPVAIDCFHPPTEGRHHAVVIFHGVEGATELTRRVHYLNAKAIAQKGYVTFFVRYFDDSDYDDLMVIADGNLDLVEIERVRLRDYKNWIEIACDALRQIDDRDDVDDIAVVGYSLGCYVGTAAASKLTSNWRDDLADWKKPSEAGIPKVVVGNFGAVWPEVEVDPTFPPTRFFHGSDDEVIFEDTVRNTVELMKQAGVADVDYVFFPNQGHVPDGAASTMIRTRTELFLKKHLPVD